MRLHATLFLLAIFAQPILRAAEPAKPTLMQQITTQISELASPDGFTDEDAKKVAVSFLEKLIGAIPKDQKLSVRVVESKPELVKVFAAYDFGIGFSGYEFVFRRGDPAKGMRYGSFVSLTHVPSE
jgi:hypothetical protein